MSMVEDMKKVHCSIFIDVFRLFGIDEVPCSSDISIGYVDGGIEVGEG
jgi:hypothetical protein